MIPKTMYGKSDFIYYKPYQGLIARSIRQTALFDVSKEVGNDWIQWTRLETDRRTLFFGWCLLNLQSFAYDSSPLLIGPELNQLAAYMVHYTGVNARSTKYIRISFIYLHGAIGSCPYSNSLQPWPVVSFIGQSLDRYAEIINPNSANSQSNKHSTETGILVLRSAVARCPNESQESLIL